MLTLFYLINVCFVNIFQFQGPFLININNLLIYIDFIYRIDHPLFNVLMINIRIIALSTKRINKFVDFRSIIHCFQFETILLQDLAMGLHYRMPFPGNQIFSQKIWENQCSECIRPSSSQSQHSPAIRDWLLPILFPSREVVGNSLT